MAVYSSVLLPGAPTFEKSLFKKASCSFPNVELFFFNIIRWKKVSPWSNVSLSLVWYLLSSEKLEQLSDWSKTLSNCASYSYKLWPAVLCWLLCQPHVEAGEQPFLCFYTYIQCMCTSWWCSRCCVSVLITVMISIKVKVKVNGKKSPRGAHEHMTRVRKVFPLCNSI